jgi:hypothetical protein
VVLEEAGLPLAALAVEFPKGLGCFLLLGFARLLCLGGGVLVPAIRPMPPAGVVDLRHGMTDGKAAARGEPRVMKQKATEARKNCPRRKPSGLPARSAPKATL